MLILLGHRFDTVMIFVSLFDHIAFLTANGFMLTCQLVTLEIFLKHLFLTSVERALNPSEIALILMTRNTFIGYDCGAAKFSVITTSLDDRKLFHEKRMWINKFE